MRHFLRALMAVALLPLTSCPSVSRLLSMYGYSELKPPSVLMAPGTMVWIKGSHPFAAGVICTADMSLGEDFVPLVSPTASADLTRATNKEFNMDADYLGVIKGDTRFHDINNITVKLENALVYELSDTDVLNYAGDRDPICAKAIRARSQMGYHVTMIASALKADVTYNVSWSREARIDAAARVAILQNLALELGADVSSATEQQIAARDLYWGIKDDTYLAQLSDPQHLRKTLPENRAFDPGSAPAIALTPDVDSQAQDTNTMQE